MMTSRYTSLLASVRKLQQNQKESSLSTRELVQVEAWVCAEWPQEQAEATRGPRGGPLPMQAGQCVRNKQASLTET